MPAFYDRCCFLVRVYPHLGKTKLSLALGFCGAYFCAVIRLMMKKLKDECRTLFGSCLGSCTNPPPIIAVDEPSKGLRVQGQPVNRLGIAEDFWSSSSEVDNSAIQSQRSVSSMSTSNLLSDPQSSAGITSNPIEFVNHGPILWNQTRQQWIGNKRPQKPTQERKISLKATYESLLGTDEPLPQPIPLPEMVKFLVDTWKKEGLYD